MPADTILDFAVLTVVNGQKSGFVRVADLPLPVPTHGAGAHDASVEATANKNAANGYAGLSGGKLAGGQQLYGSDANTAAQGNDARLTPAAWRDAFSAVSPITLNQATGSIRFDGEALGLVGLNRILTNGSQVLIGNGNVLWS